MTRGRLSALLVALLVAVPHISQSQGQQARPAPFDVVETTIEEVHAAYKSGRLTSRQLVQLYLNRIEAYDKKGPALNTIITLNSKALEEADKLDAQFKASGFVGPLHGIPVILKDQVDAAGFPTTLGSILMKDYYPGKDAFAIAKLRKAGAIVLAKGTLGEWGGGDSYGSLFGATRNPYDLERTAGGSSGGPGASIAANFATVAVGEEGSASIRRPSTWNSVVGMHPTAGLISRTGMWDGWPAIYTSLGPMARTVADAARLLDVMVGYDPDDPLTAAAVGQIPPAYAKFLDKNGLKGARIGLVRENLGGGNPDSEDFKKVHEAFEKAVQQLKASGAEVIDPVVIPNFRALMAKRNTGPEWDEQVKWYFRAPDAPFKSREEIVKAPGFEKVFRTAQNRLRTPTDHAKYYEHLKAREELMFNVLKLMADHRLDAIAYKSIEHQPSFVRDGLAGTVGNQGIPTMSTFLGWVPTIAVPAGFTRDNTPIGITFQGRPYADGILIKLAYAFEQATHHRAPPSSVPALR